MKKYILFIFLFLTNIAWADVDYFYTKFTNSHQFLSSKLNLYNCKFYTENIEHRTTGDKNVLKWGFGFVFFQNHLDYSINFSKNNYYLYIKDVDPDSFYFGEEITFAKSKVFVTSFELNYRLKNRTIITPYFGAVLNLIAFENTSFNAIKEIIKINFGYKYGAEIKLLENVYLDFNLQKNERIKMTRGNFYYYNVNLFSLEHSIKEHFINIGVVVRF